MNIHAFEVHSCTQRINREHGALWKVEGWSLKPPGCSHALKEGAFLLVEDVRSKEELVYGRAQFGVRKGKGIREFTLHP